MKKIPAVVEVIRNLTPTSFAVTLTRLDGTAFPPFAPGQYATLSFPGYRRLKGERSFSIASSPDDRLQLEFGVRVAGQYTTAMSRVRQGDQAMIGGPYGRFTFDPARDHSAVFIAGGIGITPFLGMIRAATDQHLENDLTLLYSVRTLTDAPFAPEIDKLERINPQLRVIYAISDKQVPAGSVRLIPGRITPDLLNLAVGGSPWGRSYFLCGPPAFMAAMTANLRAMGVSNAAIRTERFGVGSSAIIERGTPIPKFTFAAWGVAAAMVFGTVASIEHSRRQVLPVTTTSTTNAVPSDATTATPVDQSIPPATVSPTTTPPNTSSPTPTTSAPSIPVYTPPQPTPMPIVPRTRMS